MTGDLAVALTVGITIWVAVAPAGRRASDATPGLAARPSSRTGWEIVARVLGRRSVTGRSVRLLVSHVASLVRSGSAPGSAWATAAGVRVDSRGVPEAADLLVVVGARGSDEASGQVAAVVAASRLAADVGAPLGAVLGSIAQALSAESEARADREASLAGPQATARVLLWLPAVGVLLGVVLGVDPVATALGGGVGSAGLLVGGVLLLVGRRWSGRLVARARAAGAPP